MAEYFKGMEFGELQQFDEMAVLPVFTSNIGSIEYLTLKEAIGEKLIDITEIDDSGVVPELEVRNNVEIPVLLLDGEELLGAKQNRIVNTTILLKEKSETIIPVSCVEQGRWSDTSKNFMYSDRIASYQLRNVKSASVKKSVENLGRYSSDQRAVWDEVHKLQDKTEVHSPTSAMGDVYEAKSYDLESYIKVFELVEGQKGLLVFINGEIIGLDVISSRSAYKILHKKLIKSYALDSMVQKGDKKIVSNINLDLVDKFLKEIMKSEESKNESVGYGYDYRFASASYIGSTLVFNDEVIHASFFKSLEIEDEEIGGMATSRTRANLRQY
jgi:hypothetical protein